MITMKRINETFYMYDKNILLGECSFSLKNKSIEKFCNKGFEDDKFIIPNLAKAVLNYFDLQGIKTIICNDKTYKDLLKSIGFDEKLKISLIGYFTQNSCGGENN